MVLAARHGVAEWLMAACGAWLVGLGAFFVFVRPALLPEDLRYIGADAAALQAIAPGLLRWLGEVFSVMGGFMAGAGLLVGYLAWQLMPLRPRGAAWVLGVNGVVTFGLMSAVNFALHSDFRWLLAIPPILCAVSIAIHARAARAAPTDRRRR